MRKFKFEKKYIPSFLLTAACVVIGALCLIKAVDEIKYNQCLSDSDIVDLYQTVLIADGGNGTDIPKNTKYAMDDLKSKSFSYVKIDARLTEDKKWAALAEENISSVTNGEGCVSDYTFYELLKFNVNDGFFGNNYCVESVTEAVKYAFENGFNATVFLHNYDKNAIKNLIEDFKADSTYIYAIASSNLKTLKYVRKLDQNFDLIYYVDEITDENIQFCKDNFGCSICFNAGNSKNKKQIEAMIDSDVGFLCYGAETLGEIEDMYKLGVRCFVNDAVQIGEYQSE